MPFPQTFRRGYRRRLSSPTRPTEDVAVLEGSSPSHSQADLSPSELSLAHKGVTYGRNGAVVRCRFCEILQTGDAEFLYEDDTIAVFRPLSPVVESHVLVVPRCHIRNINKLRPEHAELLQRMRVVAELVLYPEGRSAGSSFECKFAFHKPPFNSIDHVHMHAFRKTGPAFGCFGAIKYRTETWWCRSFEEVLYRVSSSTLSSSSSSGYDLKDDLSPTTVDSSVQESAKHTWCFGHRRPRAVA